MPIYGNKNPCLYLSKVDLNYFTQFSRIQYYKSLSFYKLEEIKEVTKLMETAKINGKQGFSFNGDNAIYEKHPY